MVDKLATTPSKQQPSPDVCNVRGRSLTQPLWLADPSIQRDAQIRHDELVWIYGARS
jgi:hypothetical protein